jgi:hypothetical protein
MKNNQSMISSSNPRIDQFAPKWRVPLFLTHFCVRLTALVGLSVYWVIVLGTEHGQKSVRVYILGIAYPAWPEFPIEA